MENWTKEYLDNLVKSGCVVSVLTEEAYRKFYETVEKESNLFNKSMSAFSKNQIEKAKKDLSALAARRVSVTRNGKTFMQTVYVKVMEDPKTGKPIEHLMEQGKQVKYTKGDKEYSGKIMSVAFNEKTDKYGTARIKSDSGEVHNVSFNNIEVSGKSKEDKTEPKEKAKAVVIDSKKESKPEPKKVKQELDPNWDAKWLFERQKKLAEYLKERFEVFSKYNSSAPSRDYIYTSRAKQETEVAQKKYDELNKQLLNKYKIPEAPKMPFKKGGLLVSEEHLYKAIFTSGNHHIDVNQTVVDNVKKIFQSDIIKNTLEKIGSLKEKFNENRSSSGYVRIRLDIHKDDALLVSSDGSSGSLILKLEGDSSSADVRFVFMGDKLALVSQDSIARAAKNGSKNMAEFSNKLLKEFDGNEVKIEPISQANRRKAEALMSKMPSSNFASTNQGYEFDHENKKVDIYVSTVREARHPDEYGQRASKYVSASTKFDDAMDKNVVEPLRKIGYNVSIQAK